MDWPDADGNGAHFEKRFVDEYRYADWATLVGRYGAASVTWLAGVLWEGGDR